MELHIRLTHVTWPREEIGFKPSNGSFLSGMTGDYVKHNDRNLAMEFHQCLQEYLNDMATYYFSTVDICAKCGHKRTEHVNRTGKCQRVGPVGDVEDIEYLACECKAFKVDTKSPKKTWNDFSTINIPHVSVNGSTITFQIQDGPIKEVGVNGCQVDALGEVWHKILLGFNARFPCIENARSIQSIEAALDWQRKRKNDREKRGVEGHDKQ